MLEKIKKHSKLLIVIITIPLIWLIFFFFTFDSNGALHIIPLLILIAQIIFLVLYKKKKFLLMVLLNPVTFFLFFYTVKPIFNYLNKKPTIIKCCFYLPTSPTFDNSNLVYLDYFDDDCDWEGFYYYTLEINNFITNELITLFGNPMATQIK